MFGCVMTPVIRQTCGSHRHPGEAGATRHTAVTICIDEIGDLAVPVAGWLLPLEIKHKINVESERRPRSCAALAHLKTRIIYSEGGLQL